MNYKNEHQLNEIKINNKIFSPNKNHPTTKQPTKCPNTATAKLCTTSPSEAPTPAPPKASAPSNPSSPSPVTKLVGTSTLVRRSRDMKSRTRTRERRLLFMRGIFSVVLNL